MGCGASHGTTGGVRRLWQRRGWYTGEIRRADGVLAASFVQETLFRPGPNPFRRERRERHD